MTFIPDAIGWLATGVFAASYFVKGENKLRLTQALAALVWIAYGLVIHSLPVIGANLIVSGLAAFSAIRRRSALSPPPSRVRAETSG